jgi:aminoglycoside phosphotransferase (APT) family kinase protein
MWSKQALQFISRSFDSFPAPRVYHSCLEENNPVGVPFMILDWIEGMSMPQWRPGLPPNESARMQFLDQFSDAFLDLVLTPLTDRSGNDIEYYGMCSIVMLTFL